MSLAGDYGSDLLHCCRHHQPVGVVLALAHFLQLSLAGEFIKKATDVLLKVFTFLTKFFFFFYRFVDFRGKNKMATVATKQRLQCASRSLHRGNRSTTSRRKHKMWTHRTRRSSRQIARQNQQNGGGFFLKNGRNRFVFFLLGDENAFEWVH